MISFHASFDPLSGIRRRPPLRLEASTHRKITPCDSRQYDVSNSLNGEAQARSSRVQVCWERLRGLEQNLQTASRRAQLAHKGAKVMQFLSEGRYLAAVADGKVTHAGSAMNQRKHTDDKYNRR
jgi:hypothetical protein